MDKTKYITVVSFFFALLGYLKEFDFVFYVFMFVGGIGVLSVIDFL